MLTLLSSWQKELSDRVKETFDLDLRPDEIPFSFPPKPEMGDAATPLAFSLAKRLRMPPPKITAALAETPLTAVREIRAAGGYLNLFLDRERALEALLQGDLRPKGSPGKVIVEHTNINPNKAAHVGHLRNAVLGDTLVRLLRYLGHRVEIQNYIDDTGVQVADVVVGFRHILQWDLGRVVAAVGGSEGVPFDVFCWDLYARVAPWYEESDANKGLRHETLHAMETGEGEAAEIAGIVAAEMVQCHLKTMERLEIRYDILPHESDILKRGFWTACFEKLRQEGAVEKIPADSEDKNRGCWVMRLTESKEFKGLSDADKVIVRSNGTVTYIGKDIAYQSWKFGLLGKDFFYRKFPTPLYKVWRSHWEDSGEEAPSFGGGDRVINVIDVRQSYLQKIVREGLRQMGYGSQADRSIHFAYEMVALSQKAAEEFERSGHISLSDEDKARPFVEMSGRKGLGIRADVLLDRLEEKAAQEIRTRDADLDAESVRDRAHSLAVGALRDYMVKFNKNQIVAFDFDQALAFEGETGPYLQYACVRAENILRKGLEKGEAIPDPENFEELRELVPHLDEAGWALLTLFLRFPAQVKTAAETLDLNLVVRAFHEIAHTFHTYYHEYPVLKEADPVKRRARLLTVALFARFLREGLDTLLGIPVPERM